MKTATIGIVLSDFHKEIAEEMLSEAKKTSQELGLEVLEVKRVTGAYDIPLPLQRMLANPLINGAVVLGAVVQGETSHDEIVAFTSAQKITELSLKYDKPVGYGISGPRMTLEQAKARAKEFSVRAVEAVARML
ncbi:MAG: 6,7-dimethyl-8-ribityllumazine synthase [archaeon]|nr:6,7-dimethyl-8-ribityllumazine synthase [archaeon]